MTTCAATLTLFGVESPEEGDDRLIFLWFCSVCSSVAASIFSFFSGKFASHSWFLDQPCRDIYQIPLRLVQASTGVYLVALLLIMLGLTLNSWLPRIATRRIGRRLPSAEDMEVILVAIAYPMEVLLLWTTFILIIYIRQRAKQLFGEAYQV